MQFDNSNMDETASGGAGGAAATPGAVTKDSTSSRCVPKSNAAQHAHILATIAMMFKKESLEGVRTKEEVDGDKKEIAAALRDIHEGTYGMGEDPQKQLTRRLAAVGLAALGDDAVPPLNADEFIAWLVENRPPKCKPLGVRLYWAMLEYDSKTHKSGYDGSYVPGLREDARAAVQAWVVKKAQEN